jgi:hypothetical protein
MVDCYITSSYIPGVATLETLKTRVKTPSVAHIQIQEKQWHLH